MDTDITRPNILWICTDQQRYDTIAALGNPAIRTPHLDRLVESGAAFTRAYCQNPICQPSRSSFMTSLYPNTIHINGNGVDRFPKEVPPVSRLFADAGYTCGLVGKLHLNAVGHGVEERTDDGYSYWHYSHAPHWHPPHYPVTEGHDYADWVRDKGGDLDALLSDPDGFPEKFHHTTWCGEKADAFITANQDRPWFASVNLFYPHPPFNPAREMLDAYDPDAMPGPLFRESDIEQQKRLDLVPFQSEAFHPDKLGIGFRKGQTANYLGGRRDAGALKAHYYALVTQVDACVGRLIETLEKTGQRDNTVVIFTSDHGEMLGDHGLIYKGCRFYEGGVRVPLVFNAPGRVAAGVRADGLVELLDIAPTILEMAGLEIPSHMQGRSLGGVLAGTADPDHIRKFARCEHYDANTKRNREGQPAYGTMYRDERYKCIVYHGYDLGEIYDLQEDPGEFENLWDSADHRDLKCTLIKRSFDASVLASDWGGLPNIRRGDKTL